MINTLVFDVNETLLDLGVLKPLFNQFFDNSHAQQLWFDELLHSSLVVTLSNNYIPFGTLADYALRKVARMQGKPISESRRNEILGQVRKLPPHPDIPKNLERLQSAGFRLATLTNSSRDMLSDQLRHAGIDHFFEFQLSVDEVRRFKPAPEPYIMAAEKLGIKPTEIVMVAAHDWDIEGAMAAGFQGAYLARNEKPYNKSYRQPDYIGADMHELADQILK